MPRNSSRTSTHAVTVPATALTAATTTDVHNDSFSADTAWRLETADQNVSRPPSVDRATSAARGMQHDDAQPQSRHPETQRARRRSPPHDGGEPHAQ